MGDCVLRFWNESRHKWVIQTFYSIKLHVCIYDISSLTASQTTLALNDSHPKLPERHFGLRRKILSTVLNTVEKGK